MAPVQLEKVIDDVLKSGNVQELDIFLQRDVDQGTSFKCSQQFLNKLDKLVQKYLDHKDARTASLGFMIIYKYGSNLKLPGKGQGLSGMIMHGLVDKMMQWFEKCRHLWIQCGPQWHETMFSLSEDFFDTLMVLHEACKDGSYKVTESFLYPVGQMAVDPRIYILIRKEAVRKFNLILDKIPMELKKDRKILMSEEASDIMIKMACQISEGGDYDYQTAMTEALCRMTTAEQRKDLASHWFTMEHMVSAFAQIQDSEFETDCRRFLNMVNGMQGDKARVYSYPCLEVYLDKYELLMPADEKLEEFWIDFNLGSSSISFYFSLSNKKGQETPWETICISDNEVQSYTVTEEPQKTVFHLKLSEIVVVDTVEGSSLTIYFSSNLDILQAARKVYGESKNNAFVKKAGTSVVKTTIKITMEENSSQVVPESQMSLDEKNTASQILFTSEAPVQTPATMRMSESTSFISQTGRSVCRGSNISAAIASNKPATGKLSLVSTSHSSARSEDMMKQEASDMYHSMVPKNLSENKRKAGPAVPVAQTGQTQEDNVVPDTQPGPSKSISSNWNKMSVSQILIMPTQRINRPKPSLSLGKQQGNLSSAMRSSVPRSGPIGQKELHAKVTERLQEVLLEQNQAPALQELTRPQRKKADVREDSSDQRSSTFSDPKEPQSRGKTKSQAMVKAGAAPNKAPAKAIEMKTQQEKSKSNTVLSVKEKNDAEVTEKLVERISSHYKIKTNYKVKKTGNVHPHWIHSVNRPIFNMSWLPNTNKNVSGASGVSVEKCHDKTSDTSFRNDVFAFGIDAPLQTEERKQILANTHKSSSSFNDSSIFHSTTKKGLPVTKEKRNVKKHLFSDTDTDYTITDVSWLRNSSQKSKPKVTKYSRQAPVNPKSTSPHTYKSSDFPRLSTKPVNTTPNNQRKYNERGSVKPAAEFSKRVANGRPKRVAATATKSYREPDTDDSLSESGRSSVSQLSSSGNRNLYQAEGHMKKKSASKYQTKSYRKVAEKSPHGDSVSEQPTACKTDRGALQETPVCSRKLIVPVQEQRRPVKSPSTSVCLSSPHIETKRSAEKSTSNLGMTSFSQLNPRESPLPTSPDLAFQDTPSPVPLLPNVSSAVSCRGIHRLPSNFSAEENPFSSKTQSLKSATSLTSLRHQSPAPDASSCPAEVTELFDNHLSPVPLSPLSLPSQPLLTSTFLELEKSFTPFPLETPFPEDIDDHVGPGKVSAASDVSLPSSKSLKKRRKVTDRTSPSIKGFNNREETPFSHQDQKPTWITVSGPSRKRQMLTNVNSEGDKKNKNKRRKIRDQSSPQIKPRKLLKSFIEASAVDEEKQVTSSLHNLSSSHWEADVGECTVDMEDENLELAEIPIIPKSLYQPFNFDLKKKSQSRNNMMDIYTKLSSRTVKQHVSSFNMQVTNKRTHNLEHTQQLLMEEIHKLEENDTVLTSMEKDLNIYWKKQMVAFHSFVEQETLRSKTLKNTLQNHFSHSLEHEQRIFSSQMCLIKKDMKSLQDKVLAEMQEREVQNMKRGLHALFFSNETSF
ncbi:synaptonemal complex protein 2 [Cynoglossus semilaevis]|uniref:synaptonemal complex protein 2 n=1 Tax=Cynoglossus semilaevis TaxID=244447 RepID=UPI0007DC990A|nr:synaptonemal complex protein 2 [Cynoglossus semilaevis]